MADIRDFDPFVDLKSYREALRQMVESGLPLPRDLMPAGMAAVVVPVDLIDNGSDLVLQANLPGIKPEEVSISITGDTLTIRGSLQVKDEFTGATYLRRERRTTSFMRSLHLPLAVDVDRAEARFKDGVLTLVLPKSEAVRPKSIKIVKE